MTPEHLKSLMHSLVLNECSRPMDHYMLRTLEFVATTLGHVELASRINEVKCKAYEVARLGHNAWNDLMDLMETPRDQ